LECPQHLEQKGIEVEDLFGNIGDVIDISERFLDTLQLEVKSKSDPGSQMVGCCFLKHSEIMKSVYTKYCLNHEKAELLMEKYESLPEVQSIFIQGVETLRRKTSCFNMGSILIKPVQRILKYPLILNELIKCTETDHLDKTDLKEALTIMSEVAAFINESKRKKDIVDKYKAEEDTTLSRRISKFNMHSIGKKSSRMSQKLLTTLGMDSVNKDVEFEELEKQFAYLTHSVELFCQNVQRLKGHLHDTIVSQFNIAEHVADLYKEKQSQIKEVEMFQMANRNIVSTWWNQFSVTIEKQVVAPLLQLLEAFPSPARLILKRMDKLLDYSFAAQKLDKNKDPSKNRMFASDTEKAKATYVALNSQLVAELPLLMRLATDIYSESVGKYALARQRLVGRAAKELLMMMELPLLAPSSVSILEEFLMNHSLVCSQFGRFSYASKTFQPDAEVKRAQSTTTKFSQGTNDLKRQSSRNRTYLRGLYTAAKLYQTTKEIVPTNQFEIGLSCGDLLGVIQQKDPMGDKSRWFCDNGDSQGFVDTSFLVPLGVTSADSEENKPYISNNDNCTSQDTLVESLPPSYSDATKKAETNPFAVNARYDEVQEDDYSKPARKIQPILPFQQDGSKTHDSNQICFQSYEESAESEKMSDSQEMSPLYEEIACGSRSCVSRSISSGRSLSSPCGNFYYAMFDFEPKKEEITLIKVTKGQAVRVLQVFLEWWYVEDRTGNRGYVPASYFRQHQTIPPTAISK